jgi:hypothetical protein
MAAGWLMRSGHAERLLNRIIKKIGMWAGVIFRSAVHQLRYAVVCQCNLKLLKIRRPQEVNEWEMVTEAD